MVESWEVPVLIIRARKYKSRRVSPYKEQKTFPHRTVKGLGVVGRLRKKV